MTERHATAAILVAVWLPSALIAWLISGSAAAFIPAGVIFGAWRGWAYLRSHPVIRCEMRHGRCRAADECPCWREGWRDATAHMIEAP